ncbi:MAG: glutathione binding-like protein [Rhizobiaceae bacterium]|jgi:glutathione S-transferase|nr:glutathione binding-like protein [Rhizobiaceae bacterium]
MNLTLHFSPGACSLVPHTLLLETGIAFEKVLTNTADGTTKSAAFKQVNPKGRVPVLIIDGAVLTEVPAISSFIAAQRPDLALMGRDAMEQARVLEWFNWLSGTMHGQGVAGMFRPYRFTDDEQAWPAIKAKARETLADGHAQIESRIADREWACGDHFTAADPMLLFIYRMSNRLGMNLPESRPAYTAWAERMEKRPSVQAMLNAEGISIYE